MLVIEFCILSGSILNVSILGSTKTGLKLHSTMAIIVAIQCHYAQARLKSCVLMTIVAMNAHFTVPMAY